MTWFDWASADTQLRDFTKQLIALRKAHPVFRRRRFLSGAEASELRWFTPAGTEMTAADWSDENALAIALYLDGSDDPDRAEDGTWLLDDDFLVLVNGWWEPLEFVLPATREQASWRTEVDTYDPAPRQLRSRAARRRRPRHRQPPVHRGAVRSASRLTAPLPARAGRPMRGSPGGATSPSRAEILAEYLMGGYTDAPTSRATTRTAASTRRTAGDPRYGRVTARRSSGR